jgi:hypothetical protein
MCKVQEALIIYLFWEKNGHVFLVKKYEKFPHFEILKTN